MMGLLPIQRLKFYHILIVLILFPIFLIYACPKSTEVGPGALGCFTATMKFNPPQGCVTSNCCDTDLVSFKFVRTDLPDFDPLIKPAFGGGLPVPEEGILTCGKTIKLSSSEVTNSGFGRWQVTHRFAPNWEVTCPEVEITQCPTSANNPPVPVSHTRLGIDECIQEKVVPGEGFVPFPEPE